MQHAVATLQTVCEIEEEDVHESWVLLVERAIMTELRLYGG